MTIFSAVIKDPNLGEGLFTFTSSSARPYISTALPTLPSTETGQVRYNSHSGLNVYNGTDWSPLTPDIVQIGISPKLREVLDWAEKKKKEEEELATLAEKHPNLATLLEDLNKINDKIELVKRLVE